MDLKTIENIKLGEHVPENQGPRRGRPMELGVSSECFVAWVCAVCCILGVSGPLVYIRRAEVRTYHPEILDFELNPLTHGLFGSSPLEGRMSIFCLQEGE